MSPVVPSLAYHKVDRIPAGVAHPYNYVTPAQFAAQLGYLRATGFQSISFSQYLAYRRGDASLPARPVLITFDDGYRTNLEIALPILRRYGFTATVFLVTGLLGQTNAWDQDEIQEPLLSVPDIRTMHAAGIHFQSHTRTHPHLTRLSRDDVFRELLDSRLQLQNVLDAPVNVIAYPWGEHDAGVRQLAAQAGYDAGVVVRRRTNFENTPLFELRRIGVNHTTSLARFGWDLARLRLRGA